MFLNETLPIQSRDRLTAVETAISAGLEPATFGGAAATNTSCDIAPVALAAPLNTAVTQGGTAGSTNYTYVVADVGNVGVSPAAGVQTTTGNATLGVTNFNTVTWSSVPNHTYNVYRSASSGTPSGLGIIGTVSAGAGVLSLTLNDVGQTATNTFVPTANGTGQVVAPGSVQGSVVMPVSAVGSLVTVGAGAITVAQVLSGIIVRGGTQVGGITDTLPTAAAIVAALPGIKVGAQIRFFIRNTTGQTETLAVGSGITSAAGNTLTLATVSVKEYMLVATNVTPGSEAFGLYACGAAAAY